MTKGCSLENIRQLLEYCGRFLEILKLGNIGGNIGENRIFGNIGGNLYIGEYWWKFIYWVPSSNKMS